MYFTWSSKLVLHWWDQRTHFSHAPALEDGEDVLKQINSDSIFHLLYFYKRNNPRLRWRIVKASAFWTDLRMVDLISWIWHTTRFNRTVQRTRMYFRCCNDGLKQDGLDRLLLIVNEYRGLYNSATYSFVALTVCIRRFMRFSKLCKLNKPKYLVVWKGRIVVSTPLRHVFTRVILVQWYWVKRALMHFTLQIILIITITTSASGHSSFVTWCYINMLLPAKEYVVDPFNRPTAQNRLFCTLLLHTQYINNVKSRDLFMSTLVSLLIA